MSPFDKVLATAQIMLLAAWEALGVLAFGWNGWYIAAYWFVGLWSFNVLVASGVRMFFRLMQPRTAISGADEPEFDPEEDFGG